MIEAILLVSILIGYGISPAHAVEVDHQHNAEGDHHHCWLEWLFDCHEHQHDHDSPCEPQNGDDCSHTHVIFPGSIGHAANWTSAFFPMPPRATLAPRIEPGQFGPDGPCYGLLKPPQLS